MSAYFDAHVIAAGSAESAPLPDLAGAVLFGPDATELCGKWRAERPAGKWLHAATLHARIGANDPRFPATHPDLLDLQVPDGALKEWLRTLDAAWWPLMESLRERRGFLRLNLPIGGAPTPGVRHLAQRFPNVKILLDPFCHGPQEGWKAQVRLAENDNVWLTTLGMLPGTGCAWTDAEVLSDALHFTLGEVGAGKVLFASGHAWNSDAKPGAREFLQSVPSLDGAARELILSGNAEGL